MERRLDRFRDERGTTLIEVIVAAVLLIVITGSVTSMLDAAQSGSSQQRIQAIAADLAQSTIEDLRARKFAHLQNLDTTAPATAGGVSFTVRSQASWEMQSPPGAKSCSEASRSPEALRLSTTVTWPSMKRGPVVVDTLVAAPVGAAGQNRGSFVAQVSDADGRGVSGVTVTLGSLSRATDANGCVRFAGMNAGRYPITVSRPGYITPTGETVVNTNVDIVAGQSRSGSYEYDRAGTAALTFVPAGSANPAPATNAMKAALVRTPAMSRTWAATPAGASAVNADVTNVYPTPTPGGAWQVYPDGCTDVTASAVGVAVPRGGITTPRAQIPVPVLSFDISGVPSGGTIYGELVTRCGTTYRTPASVVPNNGKWRASVLVPRGVSTHLCVVYRDTSGWYAWQRRLNYDVDADVKTFSLNANAGGGAAVETGTQAEACTR